uniref:Uncharacterized protein n=1 Tax=Onchocerca volvulus TaxID=6282 RepID=A0A8R1TKV4_ONCVO
MEENFSEKLQKVCFWKEVMKQRYAWMGGWMDACEGRAEQLQEEFQSQQISGQDRLTTQTFAKDKQISEMSLGY